MKSVSELQEKTPHQPVRGEDILLTLDDLSWILKRYRNLFLALPPIGALVVFLVTRNLTPVFEGTALLQIGQISDPIENAAQMVTRLDNGFFQESVKQASNDKSLTFLKVSQVSGANQLEIRLQSGSPENVRQSLKGAVNLIVEEHAEKLRTLSLPFESKLEKIKERIGTLEEELLRLREIRKAKTLPPLESLLLTNMLAQTQKEIFDLEEKRETLEFKLDPTFAFPTRLVGSFNVINEQISPRTGKMISLGFAAGLLIAVLYATLRFCMNRLLKRSN